MTRLEKEAPSNSVPADAVIRGGQVLFRIIGRKGYVGGQIGSGLSHGLNLWTVCFRRSDFESDREEWNF